jgi:hypothetical protein
MRAALPRWSHLLVCVIAALWLLAVVAAAQTHPAQTIITDCSEAGLRTAAANGGLITFGCASTPFTITLASELQITKDTIIDGANQVTISGGQVTRVFHTSNYVSFTLQNITVRDGKPLTGNGSGAAIYGAWRGKVTAIRARFENNDGTSGNMETGGGAIFVASGSTLIVRDSIFSGNRGIQGGAINNLLSGLTVENSQFIDNDSTAGGTVGYGYGGAIYTDGAREQRHDTNSGTIRIVNSVFRGNRAAGQGGAVQAWVYPPDRVFISDSTFDSNQVIPRPDGSAFGGALRLGNGKMSVKNTTFVNNLARNQGGAVWIGESTTDATFDNVTLANNAAIGITGTDGLGGGVMLASGTLSLNGVTIANNHAGFMGGAIFGGGSNVTLMNTLIVSNTADNPWNIQRQCSAVLNDGGGNFQYPANNPTDSTRPECTSSVEVSDPRLGASANNGGPTWTMALLPDSPAIDAGDSAVCLPADQRGIPRPQGIACDSDAYEVVTRLSLNPAFAFAGDLSMILTVLGDNFGTGSAINWNGSTLSTSLIDRITLRAVVPNSNLSKPATIPITVTDSDLPGAEFRILLLRSQLYLPLVSNQ